MSRFDVDGDDWEFPNEGDFRAHNYQQALFSKRGRKALAELREALMALPEHRLIENALCTVERPDGSRFDNDDPEHVPFAIRHAGGEGVCAVGAYAWYKLVKAGKTPEEAFAELPTLLDEDGDGPWETAWQGERAGLTYQLAWRLGSMNDETFAAKTPEERWESFVAWIDERLAEPYDPKKAR